MVKQVLLGILIFILGAAAALIFLTKPPAIFNPAPVPATKFSLENAPSQSLKGEISAMSGAIWWQDRVATEPAQLAQAVTIQQGETLIASDAGHLTVKFADAATVTLFPKTQVDIIQTLPINLVFNQVKGISQYQAGGTAPVSVRSLNLIVTMNSGLLNVDTDDAAGTITLSLKSGQATVGYNSPSFLSKVWTLDPGDVFSYDSNLRRGYFK